MSFRKPNVLRLLKKPGPLRFDLGMNSLAALTLSQSTDNTGSQIAVR
jgi:hypothetical protein